ncbi:MAG: cytidylyltransferase domain-containing protein [Blastocatellia bacterium]
MRILGLIPARGGSKGVRRKNIKLLCGKPLLYYTAKAALASQKLDRVILSTEDKEIAQVGRECGLEAPFFRPIELAQDDTPTLPVAQHAVRWMEENNERFDALCLIQPTSPLRSAEDIDACVELLELTNADAVATILPVPAEYNPHWVYFRDENSFLRLSTGEAAPTPRRQELPAAYHREGSVYVVRRDVLMVDDSFYGARFVGYEIPSERSVNIDGPEDWERAEKLLMSYT